MKQSFVYNTPVARQHSTKLLVEMAAIFEFRLFSTDVTQEYLQSLERLMRDIYLNPSREVNLKPNQPIKLLEPLYGLSEMGGCWRRAFRKHLEQKLGMKPCVSDAALFFQTSENIMCGIFATYVDDALHAGNNEYCQLSEETEMKFKYKPREWDNTKFAGG